MLKGGLTESLRRIVMIRYYWVFCRSKLIGCFRALSEDDAKQQAYMKHGGASKYSGHSRDDFSVEAIKLC